MGFLVSGLFTVGGYMAASTLGLVHSGPGGFIATGIGAIIVVGCSVLGGWVGAAVK
jgi:hypothetical protein